MRTRERAGERLKAEGGSYEVEVRVRAAQAGEPRTLHSTGAAPRAGRPFSIHTTKEGG